MVFLFFLFTLFFGVVGSGLCVIIEIVFVVIVAHPCVLSTFISRTIEIYL